MNTNNCYSLGYIKRPVKHNGELLIFLDVDTPEDYQNMNSFLVELPTGCVPFFVEYVQMRDKGEALVKLEGIDNDEQALELKGCALWMPLDMLPQLTGNRFYYHEIIGWKAVDETAGTIGTIIDVLENVAQPILQITHPSGKEILVPLHDDILLKTDRDEKTIYLRIPDGLIDLYLS